MALQPPSREELRALLLKTLTPDLKEAEARLKQLQSTPGYPVALLQLAASNDVNDAPVRQVAAVHFKNIAKKAWIIPEDEDKTEIGISLNDQELIKNNLVELMCSAPRQVQFQVSEAISIIASVDFPDKWQNLLPQLVQKLNSPDITIVLGVLLTANSLFKSFRGAHKNDALYTIIVYSLNLFQEPLLKLFQAMSKDVDVLCNDVQQLRPRLECLRVMCRIFYSLNWQDLPEYFEDNMKLWMNEFAKFLQYTNPLLVDESEETEPEPIEKLQSAIIENLYLYADKDEEPFLPFLPNFTTIVWNRLLSVKPVEKYDTLATKSIKFLNILLQKHMHRHLFSNQETIKEILLKIVVPNMMIREIDEIKFEEDPHEYLLSDMEGYDSESRRRCSQDLLKSMCRQFEVESAGIALEQITAMLSQFAADSSKWVLKDAAIHLMLGISIKAETTLYGVSQINDKVDITDFFLKHIMPELQDGNHNLRPMVKATAIKFVATFRNQFSLDDLKSLLPLLIKHLTSPFVVVHTYAAAALEKVLSSKQSQPPAIMTVSSKKFKFAKEDIQPFLEGLFGNLFAIIENLEWNENEYAMKCVMRSLYITGDFIVPVTQTVVDKLTAALFRVAKNPRNPSYNHYLFESIAILVKNVCTIDPNNVGAFENLLFEPFETILQMDVSEFSPYVFQIFTQLLEFRESGSGLGPAYSALFVGVLHPVVWEQRSNIPAVTALLQAYLKIGAAELIAANQLIPVLGIFQKLLSSGATESNAFNLLETILIYVPLDTLQVHVPGILHYLLKRLHTRRNPRYIGLISKFFALMCGRFGGSFFLEYLNKIQAGLGFTLTSQFWITHVTAHPPSRMEAKYHVIGLTNLTCKTPEFFTSPNWQVLWGQIVSFIIQLITSPDAVIQDTSNGQDEVEIEISYDSSFSKLNYASRPYVDPFAEIKNCNNYFLKCLSDLCTSQPNTFPKLISHSLGSQHVFAKFQNMLDSAGLKVV